MVLHRLIKVIDGVSTAALPITSDTFLGRKYNRNSSFLWEFSGNPNGATGDVVLKAKLSPDATFADVYELDGTQIKLDMSTPSLPQWNMMGAGIQLYYAQRWVTESGVTPTNRNINAWILE